MNATAENITHVKLSKWDWLIKKFLNRKMHCITGPISSCQTKKEFGTVKISTLTLPLQKFCKSYFEANFIKEFFFLINYRFKC